jgi:hypothetical protein
VGRRARRGLLPLTTPTRPSAVRGALPHHNLHVFAVYRWLGLLRRSRSEEPLRVLDRCRIRWGQVESVGSDVAVVRTRPLTWDGHALGYGDTHSELVQIVSDGRALVRCLRPGEWVSMHWNWLCDRLTHGDVRALAHSSDLSLTAANGILASTRA